ncbi:MAG: cobalamin-dependent protein [Desulfobacteraceae bacterium]|jgi:5-methyltetrahydrofolate--homocysteine methyltransferase
MSDQLFELIQQQITALNEKKLLEAVDEALSQGINPVDIISKGLSMGLEAVGDNFEKGEFFLPELILSGEIMKKAIDKLRPLMVSEEKPSAGKVLLGTIEGDIHYIGKNIFSAVLEGDGYEVHDLGVDVPPVVFLEKAKEIGPDIIGMSALISIAVSKIAEAVNLLRDNEIQSKVLVGGAALTEQNAKTIGADAYAFDAWQGLRLVREQTNR